ncbi:MAG: hypothetical protein KF833_02605 [Verrucomicrobiae bacterium]|nr:hypothetical protein [Verrucomicrobiae bacterium]
MSQTLFLVMALLWVPLTARCVVASVPGLDFLRCADHEHSGNQDHQSCDDCGCCTLESEKYQSSRWEDLAPDLHPNLVGAIECIAFDIGSPAEESEGVLIAAPPPPLSTSWAFALRLALPVRAPSAAS